MKFLVEKEWSGNEERPCRGVKKGTFIYVDERTTDDPAKVPANKGETEWWYGDGKNHRVEKGRIKRDFVMQGWFIEIPDLDGLIAFYKKHGKVSLDNRHGSTDVYRLTIPEDDGE